MTINATSGALSGTPSVVSDWTLYTISASNGAKHPNGQSLSLGSTFMLNMGVFAPPSNCTYSNYKYSYWNMGTYVQSPSCWNYPTSYSISPKLSMGLYLSSVTGFIQGMPSATSDQVIYTLTATSPIGTTTTTVMIKIMAGKFVAR